MACGNNKVSRTGLHSQPTLLTHPALPPADQAVRQRAVEAAKAADRQMDHAKQSLQTAMSRADVRTAVDSALRALDAARRAGGDKHAQSRLRDLERQVQQLRRAADDKETEIIGREVHRIAVSQTLRDTLGRQSLGVPRLRIRLARSTVADSGPGGQEGRNLHAEEMNGVPNVSSGLAAKTEEAIAQAEDAAGRIESASAAELDSAKRATQRALAFARKGGATQAELERLQRALLKIQRAESSARLQLVDAQGQPGTDSQREQWVTDYLSKTPGDRELVTVDLDNASYIFDATRSTPEGSPENRVVGVYGKSGLSDGPRDKARMAGHPNPRQLDRGHFLARSAGGGYDINLFPQDSPLNRGHSNSGRVWRELENYLVDNVNTEFFIRPTYGDTTDYPTHLEFGIRLHDGSWRVETFNNRP